MSNALIDFFSVVAGMTLLVVGGTVLVRGAIQLAAAIRISPLIVGLTVVAFGTSAPELFVNLLSAMEGRTALAFGNVVGSNIANLALVLGAAALIQPITLQGSLVLREVPLYLLGCALLLVFASDALLEGRADVIGTSDAIALLLLFAVFIYLTARNVARDKEERLITELEELASVPSTQASWLGGPLALIGVVMLYAGGDLTVRHAVSLATQIGISENVVGLVLVAVGTSLPELVTSVIAAMRGESDLALGNVVGSNLFNALLVLPVTALVMPIPVPPGGVADLLLALALGAVLIPAFVLDRGRMRRAVGAVLLGGYIGYAIWRLSGA